MGVGSRFQSQDLGIITGDIKFWYLKQIQIRTLPEKRTCHA